MLSLLYPRTQAAISFYACSVILQPVSRIQSDLVACVSIACVLIECVLISPGARFHSRWHTVVAMADAFAPGASCVLRLVSSAGATRLRGVGKFFHHHHAARGRWLGKSRGRSQHLRQSCLAPQKTKLPPAKETEKSVMWTLERSLKMRK